MPLNEETTVNAQFSLIKNDKGYALISILFAFNLNIWGWNKSPIL